MALQLLRRLSEKPEYLVDHLSAYAALAGAESRALARDLRIQFSLGLALALLLLLTLNFIGVAVLFLALTPPDSMNAPGLLLAVPLIPALLALIVLVVLMRRERNLAFKDLRQQLSSDSALLRQALQP